uniref:NADH-ubiquinone oxidoreductase chain 6 n=1 Tax=Gonatodes albogularis TaxID=460622 RepID=A0A1Y1CC14_GONAL|nr:NADH dehydrogenase subunit 6 [Gonatodes albogularis]BAX77895.1 NADH dehydrogenase subunit 6 [Gonatodes albogularis]
MTYVVFLMVLCGMMGFLGVAANPAPLFGALGLVVSAAMVCGVLVSLGESFISLVLFLIYLGGMLVVFAYSVALAVEPYPATWGDLPVLVSLVGLVSVVVVLGLYVVEFNGVGLVNVEGTGFFNLRADYSGGTLLFSSGGPLLMLCGGALMLSLFVVLELTRGLSLGGVRAL